MGHPSDILSKTFYRSVDNDAIILHSSLNRSSPLDEKSPILSGRRSSGQFPGIVQHLPVGGCRFPPRASDRRLGFPMLSRKTRGLLDSGLVVPGPGDPGRRKVGSEARLPREVGAEGEGTSSSRPGGLEGTPKVFDAVRRGLRSLGCRWSTGCQVVGCKGRTAAGVRGQAGQAAKKGLDF